MERVEVHLRNSNYSRTSIFRYKHTWKMLSSYMEENKLDFYSREIGNSFLKEYHRGKEYHQLNKTQKGEVRHIGVLSDMIDRGRIREKRCRLYLEGKSYCDELGIPFESFFHHQSQIRAPKSVASYKERLYHFYLFLSESNKTLKTFTASDAISYLEHLRKTKSPSYIDAIINSTRIFFRFLCQQEILPDNREYIWMNLLKVRRVRNRHLPDIYTSQEVETIIASIDRTNPCGKRDYAMILLAARYGLRSSDIVGLRFCNLDWEHNRICVVQQKTGRKVTLPLSEEVGYAVIDYVKHGRPNIDSPFVFIKSTPPFGTFSESSLSYHIAIWMRKAGVKIEGRKGGAHAFRHSLATNLLGVNQPMPVISEILGHSSCESTSHYIRVNIDMLRQCALDVPFVSSSFYDNLYD